MVSERTAPMGRTGLKEFVVAVTTQGERFETDAWLEMLRSRYPQPGSPCPSTSSVRPALLPPSAWPDG